MGESEVHIVDSILTVCIVLSMLLLVGNIRLARKKVTDGMQIEVGGRCADFITKTES